MGKYIHGFETISDFTEAYEGSAYLEPWVSYTLENTSVEYNADENSLMHWKTQPLTFEILSDGEVSFNKAATGSETCPALQYQKNESEWNLFDTSTTISVISGDIVRFKGVNSFLWKGVNYSYRFITTCNFNACGNILSLIYGDDFLGKTTIDNGTFCRLFYGCTGLIDASKLCFIITSLYSEIYQQMFYNCTSLKYPPKLPATTISAYCYKEMFYGCTSLIEAPELPATTLAYQCYAYMFQGCTSLVIAPELPAETLVNGCYTRMFDGCTHLSYVKALFTTTPTSTYTSKWLNNVASTGTFVKGKTKWNLSGENGVPTGWTITFDTSDLILVEENITITVDSGHHISGIEYLEQDADRWFISDVGSGFALWTYYDQQVGELGGWATNAPKGTYTGNLYR